MKTIRELMQWRFACQHFDQSKKIDQKDLREILETTHLAPSSFGLQAWKMIVVTDAALREKMLPFCDNQPQISEASVLIIFCARTDLMGENGAIGQYVKFYQKVKGKTEEQIKSFRERVSQYVQKQGAQESLNWLQKQIYLALETLMMSAAEKGIDSCPMEGFQAEGLSKVLKLKKNLVPTVIAALGYRNIKSQPPKVRLPFEQLVEFRD